MRLVNLFDKQDYTQQCPVGWIPNIEGWCKPPKTYTVIFFDRQATILFQCGSLSYCVVQGPCRRQNFFGQRELGHEYSNPASKVRFDDTNSSSSSTAGVLKQTSSNRRCINYYGPKDVVPRGLASSTLAINACRNSTIWNTGNGDTPHARSVTEGYEFSHSGLREASFWHAVARRMEKFAKYFRSVQREKQAIGAC